MNTTNFLTITIVGLLAVMSPGPDFLIVTRNSILYSKRVGLCTALGIALGTIVWVVASLLGIALVISKTVILFNVVKWLGAAYLVYLGIKSFRKSKESIVKEKASELPEHVTGRAGFWNGLLTNLSNPKAALFFVSFFSALITPETPGVLRAAYGLEISCIALLWFSLLATVLSTTRIKGVFESISTGLHRVTGALFIALGIKLALSKAN